MWAFETQGSDVVPDIVTIGKRFIKHNFYLIIVFERQAYW